MAFLLTKKKYEIKGPLIVLSFEAAELEMVGWQGHLRSFKDVSGLQDGLEASQDGLRSADRVSENKKQPYRMVEERRGQKVFTDVAEEAVVCVFQRSGVE